MTDPSCSPPTATDPTRDASIRGHGLMTDDDYNPMRGIIWMIALQAPIWALIALVVYALAVLT